MTPSRMFDGFAVGTTSERGSQNGDDQVSGTSSGVTFTLTAPSSASEFNIFMNFSQVLASNTNSTAANTFVLTWDDGAGGTQANSISFTGTFNPGQIALITAGGGTVQGVNGAAFSDQVTGIQFQLSGVFDFAALRTLNLSINCYTAGTMMSTPHGPRAVETLTAGDMVLTADGRETPVTWLGRQPVNTRLAHPAKANPIRITAGALGNGLPERDLRLSPDHAICIDGLLINAGALVNGSTIYQEQGKLPDSFTYYHIETEAHELLLAEGVAAESFIAYAGRDTFENGDEATVHIPEMDLPRISAARLVPEHIRQSLMPVIAAQ